MKALLIRVGIDKAYGSLSPVFNDETFIYIPVYSRDINEKESKETRTYKDYEETLKYGLESFIPKNIYNKVIHLDPEFKTFTYGDPAINKRKALLSLKKGDLLVFYMGGEEVEDSGEIGCYIFAYFKVEKAIDWNKTKEVDMKKVERMFKNNAHIRSSKSRNNLVLVKGGKKSKLLRHCVKITRKNPKSNNPPYLTSKEIQDYLGIRENITRAIPIWIKDEKYFNNLKEILSINKTVNLNQYRSRTVSYNHFCRILERDRILTKKEKLLLGNFLASIPESCSDYENTVNFHTDISYDEYKHEDRLYKYYDIFYKKIKFYNE